VTVPTEPAPSDTGPLIDWHAVFRGATAGLFFLVLASILEAILDRNIDSFNDSGWIYPLFVLILFGYMLAGFGAGRLVPESPLSNGLLAGLGAFVLWIPVRIVIWIVRDENRALFTGHSPALRPGQIFGHLLIAAALGMFGGFLGARSIHRNARRS
jgi:hypothetical protein